MQTNTLSNRQDLHLIHKTTEGAFNRSLPLLLLTNKESAYRAIQKNRFTNDIREFGRGLYFVETLEESEAFEIEDKAVVLCQVFVGVSLILTKPDQNITEKFLKGNNWDSVKGYLSMNQKYYVVYNYKNIQKILALKAESSIVRNCEVGIKCVNHLCKFHGTNHIEECQLYCKQKVCRYYNGYHEPPCQLRCDKVNCELFETFHDADCKLRCTWENCIMFGKYHETKCIHLDHEQANEPNEGLIYNKVNFREKMNKVEAKKKCKKFNKKRMDDREYKWNNTDNLTENKGYTNKNKFSMAFNDFPQIEQSKKPVLKGYYEIDGKYELKKVKDGIFDAKNSCLNQFELFNEPKAADDIMRGIQKDQLLKVTNKETKTKNNSLRINLIDRMPKAIDIIQNQQTNENKNNLSRQIETNIYNDQNKLHSQRQSSTIYFFFCIIAICAFVFIIKNILF